MPHLNIKLRIHIGEIGFHDVEHAAVLRETCHALGADVAGASGFTPTTSASRGTARSLRPTLTAFPFRSEVSFRSP